MPISDFWVQALLSSTNPSPVPSTTSTLSSNDENLENSGFLPTNNLLWNPSLIQQFLALYQIQAAQNIGLNMSLNMPLTLGTPQISKFDNIAGSGKNLSDTIPMNSRKRQFSELPTFADPQNKNPNPDMLQHPRRHKSRKIGEDTVTSSPVSGMFIKEESDVKPVEELQKEADLLDETAAYVEVTDESRQKIEEIPNVIGDCVCRLCKVKYDDVFKLAQHKCPRIAHEEYKCPDCEKVFSCPANLASHRRWHKPKGDFSPALPSSFSCQNCFGMFPTKKLMKAHAATCQRSPLQSLLARVISPI